MSLKKKLKDSAFVIGTETTSCWVVRLSRINAELGVVAQKIRFKMEIAKRKEKEAHDRKDNEWEDVWSGYHEAMEEVLGLLVEKEENHT